MTVRRAVFLAVLALPIVTAPAFAQFQPPPAQQRQEPPCIKKFVALRDEAAKRAREIQAAGQRKQKPSPQVACKLFTNFVSAEAKFLQYAIANGTWCGIPDQVVKEIKTAHAKSSETRTKICRVAAAGPPRPAGPTLSDMLGADLPDSRNIKPGHGTFDTLTGTPLGNR